MDNAVTLVEAYLRVNGYFTVTEYPIVLRDVGGVAGGIRAGGGMGWSFMTGWCP